MEKIKDVAIAYWRLEKWIKAANVDKKAAAESSLRSIKRFLDGNSIEIEDLTGDTYDSGLAVEIVCKEDGDGSPYGGIEKITEMVKPIVLHKGLVIQFGQAIIGNKLKLNHNAKEIAITEEKYDIEETLKEPIDINETIKVNAKIISEKSVLNNLIAFGVVALLILSIINLFSNLKLNNEVKEISVGNKVKETGVDNKLLAEIKAENKYSIGIINEKLSNIEKKMETKQDEVVFIKYTIKTGDCLEKICREKNINYTKNIMVIKRVNLISEEDKLYVGQTILLPKIN